MPTDGSRFIGARARVVLFTLLAALLVFATEQVVEHFARQRALEQERNGVLNELSVLRARLEGVVNANLFLTHGLTAVIAARPDIDQAGFDAIARKLVDERHALRNLAAAPDMVIALMYPLAVNEAFTGHYGYSLDELPRWQAVILGREDRIQALKAEVNDLLAEQDRAIRYPSQAGPS